MLGSVGLKIWVRPSGRRKRACRKGSCSIATHENTGMSTATEVISCPYVKMATFPPENAAVYHDVETFKYIKETDSLLYVLPAHSSKL